MKVVAQTEKMVVIDLENDFDKIADEVEFVLQGEILLPQVLRVYQDRIEIVVKVVGSKKKTLEIHFDDAILMNRVLHKICGKKMT